MELFEQVGNRVMLLGDPASNKDTNFTDYKLVNSEEVSILTLSLCVYISTLCVCDVCTKPC